MASKLGLRFSSRLRPSRAPVGRKMRFGVRLGFDVGNLEELEDILVRGGT